MGFPFETLSKENCIITKSPQAETFECACCLSQKTSKTKVLVKNTVNDLIICNSCYGMLLSKQSN